MVGRIGLCSGGSGRLVGRNHPGFAAPSWALACACTAAAFKGWIAKTGNNGYALLMITGWAAAILMLANVPIAEHLGHALFDGQLYFTGVAHLVFGALFLVVMAVILPWLSGKLLLERMFPDFFRASGLSAWRFHLIFDLLVAAGLALATASIGVMAHSAGIRPLDDRVSHRAELERRTARGDHDQSFRLRHFISFSFYDRPAFRPVLVIVLSSLAVFGYLIQMAFRQGAQSPPGLI